MTLPEGLAYVPGFLTGADPAGPAPGAVAL
jgi:hypothetical protein